MKKMISLLLTVCLLAGLMTAGSAAGEKDYTIVDPYKDVDWDTFDTYKANLHAHTTASDGRLPLSEVVERYYDQGYDILAITDHGVITNGWNNPVRTNGIFNGFQKTEPLSEEDYTRVTTGSDRNGRGMTDITGGIECNMAVVSKTHVNGYFTQYGQGEWGKENDYKTATVKIEQQGGCSVLNHVGDWLNSNNDYSKAHSPFYINYIADIFTTSKTCLGMEIMNNSDNCSRADRIFWDELLQVVIPTGRNIWAFADDDSEFPDEIGRSFEFFPMKENTEENVKNAMISGAFFAASKFNKADRNNELEGDPDIEAPIVTKLVIDERENTLTVTAKDCDKIEWVADGEVIATGNTIDLNDYESKLGCYVRFQLSGEGGFTYSQAFELKYEGRQDKPIPASPVPDGILGKIFWFVFQTLPVSLWALIIEKIMLKTGDLPK